MTLEREYKQMLLKEARNTGPTYIRAQTWGGQKGRKLLVV
jgi:hypothetical protein